LNTSPTGFDRTQQEVRIAVNEDLDRILTAWAAEQTYTKLPWDVRSATYGNSTEVGFAMWGKPQPNFSRKIRKNSGFGKRINRAE
jgi:hypothetical protein